MSADLVPAIASQVVAVTALAVSAISVYLGYRERTRHRSDSLWQARLDVALRLHKAGGRLVSAILAAERAGWDTTDPKRRRQIPELETARVEQETFVVAALEAELVFPRRARELVRTYRGALQNAVDSDEQLTEPLSAILWRLHDEWLVDSQASLRLDRFD